jgi:acetyltransferase
MLSPQAMTDPLAVAQAIIEVADKLNRSLICCWMGEEQVREARKLLEASGIPAFRMPETAIELFHHISKYYRNQKLLLQTPEPTRQYGRPEAEGAKMLIEALLAERRKVLSEMESKAILRAFRCRWRRPWLPARRQKPAPRRADWLPDCHEGRLARSPP